jgi:hypothetical protein
MTRKKSEQVEEPATPSIEGENRRRYQQQQTVTSGIVLVTTPPQEYFRGKADFVEQTPIPGGSWWRAGFLG